MSLTFEDFTCGKIDILTFEQKQKVIQYFSVFGEMPATTIVLHKRNFYLSREAWIRLFMIKFGEEPPVVDLRTLDLEEEEIDLENDARYGIYRDLDLSRLDSMDRHHDPDLITVLSELGSRAFPEMCDKLFLKKVPTSIFDYLKIGLLHPESCSDSVEIDWKKIVNKTCDECEPAKISERLIFLKREAEITELYIHGSLRFYHWHESYFK